MNWMVRNLAALMCGAMTSGLAVAFLLYFEARDGSVLFNYTGQTMLGFTFLAWIPLGTIAAGFAGAAGYLAGGTLLRLRPAAIALGAVLVIAGFMVFLGESAEFSLYMQGWPRPNGGPTKSLATYGRFLGSSVLHTPLNFWSDGSYESYSSADVSDFYHGSNSNQYVSQLAPTGDSRVDGISGGVSGMMSSSDISQTQAGQKMGQVSQGIESIKARIHSHGSEWKAIFLQTAGFSLGGILVMLHLRKHPYCKGCMLLLKKKGTNTRYYSRTRDMRAAVDDVLTKARDKQLQQAIHAQVARGADRDGSWSEYSSILEIRRCVQCRMHMMHFRTRRKEEDRWKDIDLLGFTTTSQEQLDFA